MKKFAAFVSGRGAFLRFTLRNKQMIPHSEFKCIITDRSGKDLADISEEFDIPVISVNYKNRPREEVDTEILNIMNTYDVNAIILNYNKLLGQTLINAYKDIFNLHLSLLPLHRGFGAIEAAYNDNDFFFGATVHRIDESIDGGKIMSQVAIPRTASCTLENMTQHIFYCGSLLQLDNIYRLTEGASEKIPLFEKGYFNPPLSIDPSAARDNYLKKNQQ